MKWSWAELRRDRRGTAAVEAAIVSAVLILPLMCGLAGAGQALALQARLDRAVHTAMFYIWATPGATTAAIQSAAQAGFGTDTLTATATNACYCMAPDGTRQSAGVAVACNTSCTSGKVLATFVTMTVSASVSLVLPMPATVSPWTLRSSGTVRSS